MKGPKHDLEGRVLLLEHGIEKLTAKLKIQKGNFMLYKVKIRQQINDLKEEEIQLLQNRVKFLEEKIQTAVFSCRELASPDSKEHNHNVNSIEEIDQVQNLDTEGNGNGQVISGNCVNITLLPFTNSVIDEPVPVGRHTQDLCITAGSASTNKKKPKINSTKQEEVKNQSKPSKEIKPKRRSSRTKKNPALDLDIQLQANNLECIKLDEKNDSAENFSENDADFHPPPASKIPAKRTRTNSHKSTITSEHEGQGEGQSKAIEKAKRNLTSNKTFIQNESTMGKVDLLNLKLKPCIPSIKPPENGKENPEVISNDAAQDDLDDDMDTQPSGSELPSTKLQSTSTTSSSTRGRKKVNSKIDPNFEREKSPRKELKKANGNSRNSYTSEFDQFLATSGNNLKNISTTRSPQSDSDTETWRKLAKLGQKDNEQSKANSNGSKAENDAQVPSATQDTSKSQNSKEKNQTDKIYSSESDSDDSEDDFVPTRVKSPIKPPVASKKSKITSNENGEAPNHADLPVAHRTRVNSPIKPLVTAKKSKVTLNGNGEARNDLADLSDALPDKNPDVFGEAGDADLRKETPGELDSSDEDSSDDSDDEGPKKDDGQQATLVQRPRWMIEQRLDLSTRRSVTPTLLSKPVSDTSTAQVRRTPAKKSRPGF